MKKLFVLLPLLFLLVGCVETMALLGPASSVAGGGNMVQSTVSSAINYGVKKQTGKSPMQHALAYAEEKNPNKKKEKCMSIKKTNSEACMIVNKQIALAKTTVEKKISSSQAVIKKKTKVVLEKTIEAKESPKKLISALKAKIKEYDSRWLDRIKKSNNN